MAGCFALIGIIIFIVFLINFPLATLGLVIGIGIAIWGFTELSINKELGAKSKKPLSIALTGLFIIIVGFGAQGAGDDAPTTSEITEVVNEEQVSSEESNDHKSLTNEKAQEEEAEKAEEKAKQKEAEEEMEAKAKAEIEKEKEEILEKSLANEKAQEEEEEEAKKAEEEAKQKEAEKEIEAKAIAEAEKKKNETNATVTRVIDGDTIEVSMNGKTEDIRLLLIDTPETVHPQKGVEPYGPEASQFVKDKLEGEKVRVKVGSEERDNYDRMLAYVYLGDETIQEMLLGEGLATTAYLYNDLTMLEEFHAAQQPAIDAGIGVWSIPGYAHVDHDHGYHYEEEEEPVSEPEPESEPEQNNSNLMFDPNGPDRNCGDFNGDHAAAQAFFEAAGGPENDPHDLNRDTDGIACDSLQ